MFYSQLIRYKSVESGGLRVGCFWNRREEMGNQISCILPQRRYMGSGAEEPLFSWLTRFCAYRERCIKEVRLKLQSKGFMGEAAEEFIIKLQEQGYLNEERYAVLFAGGHFRQKQWGRRKIEAALRAKGIPAPVIRNALNQLSASEYRQTLFRLTEKIWRQQARYPPAIRWARVRAALLRRGYEPEKMTEARQHLATLEKKTGGSKKNH